MAYLMVFVGAGVGASLRYAIGEAMLRLGWAPLPLATLLVNVVGCFAIGLLVALLPRHGASGGSLWLLLGPGLLGGFTTFSAFGVDALNLWHRGIYWGSAAYVAASILLSLVAVAAGFGAARALA